MEATTAQLLSGQGQLLYTSQGLKYCLIHSLSYLVNMHVLLKPLYSTIFKELLLLYVALPPPVDVQATQSSSSAPVEVSWSPPTDGDINITGYRIFFGSGQNMSVSRGATSVGIRVMRSYDNESVFLRSEADGLFSELTKASVGEDS